MANFAVVDYQTAVGSLIEVLAAMETKLETIDDAKALHLVDVKELSGGSYVGIILYGA
tara:strand:+ start:1467 stop:1640 length:174 start_codon:yes stop_codon:yes gene_type:complete